MNTGIPLASIKGCSGIWLVRIFAIKDGGDGVSETVSGCDVARGTDSTLVTSSLLSLSCCLRLRFHFILLF